MTRPRRHAGIAFLVVVVGGLVCGPGAWGIEFAGGTGEPNDPYQIATAEQVLAIRSSPDLIRKHYVLVASIDFGGMPQSWSVVHWFSGTFDGKGHTIRNLRIESGVGFFGRIDRGAEVRNLGLVDISVTGTVNSGGLASHNSGRVLNCYSTGTVTGAGIAGGLVAWNMGTVADSHSTATVVGANIIGGLVGLNLGTISSCYSTGDVAADSVVGGLVGRNAGEITSSHAVGAVTGLRDHVGGLVGDNPGTIASSHADATVVGQYSLVGGLVGKNGGSISSCHSTGHVTGQDSVGGLVGSNTGGIGSSYSAAAVVAYGRRAGGLAGDSTGSISCCYSTGSVEGEDEVGGLVGYSSGKIAASYSVTPVMGYGWRSGALVGQLSTGSTAVESCYFLLDTFGWMDNGIGTPLTEDEMKRQASFQGWDFWGTAADGTSDPWFMPTNAYPVLAWQLEVTGLRGVPNVAGLLLDEARMRLTAAGFVVSDVSYDFDRVLPGGRVIHAVPYPIASAGAGIQLFLSSGGAYDWSGNPGDGTPANPYQIETAGQLESLIDHSELWDKHFILSADMDMAGRTYPKALIAPDVDDTREGGFQGTPFTGVFDGQGHAIRNLTIWPNDVRHDYVGLFGMIAWGARIEDLRLLDADVKGGSGTSSYVGVLAGYNSGTLRNCFATGLIDGGKGDGLVGFNTGSLIDCRSDLTRVHR